jgi:2-polyprenyl-6-methoxyphenol hydroxylase-like FAD-dependent oxidoreductase
MGWWMIRDALLEEVRANSNIEILQGYPISSFDDTVDSTCIQVQVEKSSDSETRSNDQTGAFTLRARLLVAADGCYSTMREMLNLEPALWTGKTQWRSSLIVPEGSPLEPFLDKGIVPLFHPSNSKAIHEMNRGKSMVGLFNLHPKLYRRMPFTLTTELPVAAGTDAREIFDQLFQDPEQQNILQEIWRLADPVDLSTPLPISVVKLPENDVGWGGRGRVTIIGDAAHALRPASGLGGAMAFEDVVILCRALRARKESVGDSFLEDRDATHNFVLSFENSRIERVRKIWDSEWDLSERAYKGEIATMTEDFRKWVHDGV